MNTLPAIQQQHGLNGWFGNFVKGVCKVAIGLVGGYVSSFPGGAAVMTKFTTWFDKQPFNFKIAPSDTPAADQAIIKPWNDTYFLPFLTAITLELKAAVEITNPVAMLAAMNIVYDKMTIVKEHYDLYDTSGLSDEGLDDRSYIIEMAFTPLFEVIKDRAGVLGATQGPLKIIPSKYNFAPLFSSTPIASLTGLNYKLPAGYVPPATTPPPTTTPPPAVVVPGTTPPPATTLPVVVLPGSGIKTTAIKSTGSNLNTKNTLSPGTITTTVKTQPQVTPPAAAPTEKSNTGLIVGGIALLGIIWYATRKKGKTTKK